MLAGSAGTRPEKRARTDTDAPAPNKRPSYLPYARGGYNSEEWVFDDEDEDDEGPAEQGDEGGEDDERAVGADGDLQETGIRSLEVDLLLNAQPHMCFCNAGESCRDRDCLHPQIMYVQCRNSTPAHAMSTQ